MKLIHKRSTRKKLSPLPEEQDSDHDIVTNSDDMDQDEEDESSSMIEDSPPLVEEEIIKPKKKNNKKSPPTRRSSVNTSNNKRKRPVVSSSSSDSDEEDDDDDNSSNKSEDDEDDDEEEDFSRPSEVISNRAMTKRQRAKYNQDQDDDDGKFLELPMESNKKKTLTEEEQALKRSEVARRRKHQSVQRAEKDKADTINRLLKKQASKSKRVIKDDGGTNGDNNTMSNKMLLIPGENVRYTTTKNGSQLSLPASLLDDLVHHCMKRPIPRRITCDIHGCENEKKYTAKTSGKAVCSLEHYQLAERT